MTKAETEFNERLDFLKDFLKISSAPVSNGSQRNIYVDLLQDPYRRFLFQAQIKIMVESGIFYKGGLKGKILKQTQLGTVIDYKVWPISNLKELLDKLASIMTTSAEPKKIDTDFVSSRFDDLLSAFDRAAGIARLGGGVRMRSIVRIRKDLADLKEKAISRRPNFNQNKGKMRIAIEIAETLIAYLPPKTPDLTIAERTKELLAAFGKGGVKVETLRRMVAKKRVGQDKTI